ncbi:MAG: FimV family protein [Gammaproteobacteria bacterium]|nr:FimV family protein [Gammaproteobacteria bacterium]
MSKLSAPAKRLAPAMAILAMLIPAVGYALGLGNIAMKSALNQPLDAQIELLSVRKGDLNNLTVKLGSVEDFQRVGADRAFFLTKINFEVVRRKNGTAYVQLTTTQTVTEPFLDFVVEARWPRGRILREFTVLVDPPVLSDEAPAPLQQAVVSTQQAAPARRAPARTARPAPIRSRAAMAPVARQPGELTYGPVQYNDTLYEIANQMRPAGVTVDQMMLALVRNNPNAFYGGNVNQLKAGYVLRVDDINELSAFSVAEANAEVNRQHSEWRARKSGKLVRQADASTGGRVVRGEGTSAGRAGDQASLKLVAPGSRGAGSGAGDESVDQLREDLLLAAEALDANRQETDELKSRLAEMEEQLEAMQRLIMLKDDEMQALQAQAGVEPEPVEAEMPIPEAGTEEMAAEALTEEGAEVTEVEASAEVEETTEPVPAPAAPVEEPGLLDDPMVMYGGLGVLLLLIIAAVVQRRRRKMQDSFEESILNVGGADDNAGATAESMNGGESSMVSDFAMSEMSGMSGIEADAADVDPVSEADVYLAYGRHQQAEDILREALEKEPDRHEIKLKMLEVFFAARDRESFEQQAQELHDALGDESDPMWVKAVTMGTQLCPGSDLFGGDSAEALKEDLEEDTAESDDDLLDFDFDIDSDNIDANAATGDAKTDEMFAELEAATSSDVTGEAPTASDDNSLDFDMDMGSDASAETTKDTSAKDDGDTATDDKSLDFDVSSLDFNLDTDTDSGSASETVAVSADDDGSLDFDLGDIDEAVVTEDAISEIEADGTTEGVDEPGDELGDDVFGEVDEIGTKLDLAKAYVDMGDGDGARSILEEVMEEGDGTQKKQAEELLSQIA